MKSSAIKIQRWFRATKIKKEILAYRKSVNVIQKWYLTVKEIRVHVSNYQSMKRSAIFIQRRPRLHRLGKLQRRKYLLMKCSAIKIQRWYRTIKQNQKSKNDKIEESMNILKLQLTSATPKSVSQIKKPRSCTTAKVTPSGSCKRKLKVSDVKRTEKNLSLASSSKTVFKSKSGITFNKTTGFNYALQDKLRKCLPSETKDDLQSGVSQMDTVDNHVKGMTQEEIAQLWNKATRTEVAKQSEDLLQRPDEEDENLKCLREAAQFLLNGEHMQEVLKWVRSQIAKKTIEVKDEIDLSRNTASRRLFVQIVFCYNPVWLRIGLEILCGIKIPFCDYNTLIVFIIRNLMSNEIFQSSNPSRKKYYMNINNLKNYMNEFILEKFFFLVYFLDQAKTNYKLIPSDPPLFQQCSPFKSSQEVLDNFMQEYLKCVTCIKKAMDRHLYKVYYKM